MLVLKQKVLNNRSFNINLRSLCNNKDINKSGEREVNTEFQWRASKEQQREWYSKLKLFASDTNNTDVIRFLQQPIDLRPSTIKKWYKRKSEDMERALQSYIPQRNQILGDDLAASHFIIFRGGKVKFHGNDKWIIHDEKLEYNLPNKYVPSFVVQAIDCSNVNLFYEGLENFSGLRKLEWLSLKGSKYIDDWCLDRISHLFRDNIKYLNLKNCKNITYRGIGVLYKLNKLETLVLDSFTETKELELTCLMLQELSPNLDIRTQD